MKLADILDPILSHFRETPPDAQPVAVGAPRAPTLPQYDSAPPKQLPLGGSRYDSYSNDTVNALGRGTYGVAGAPPPGPMPDQILRPAAQPGLILRDAPAVNPNMRGRVINSDTFPTPRVVFPGNGGAPRPYADPSTKTWA